MAIYKCKVCAGTLEVSENQTTATCNYCGVEQTLPKLNNELIVNIYDRANHFRRNNEFDKAEKLYEQIILEDYTDSEAYWSLLLCKYGIEYVEDVKTGKRIPTVNKTQYVSIFDDANYKKAIEYADSYQKEIYERDASTINEIQKKIITISQKEDPYDIFISYKETDEQGRRTRDSVMANELYHQLANEGYKVFFSRITLEKKLGTEYEPYIFAALNSAKVMIVIGTKPEFFNAVWVRNEWSRFLNIVKDSKGSKILIPAYRDMDPYDLPEEFSHLQAQDMNKLGFVQDIIHGIKKIVKKDKPKEQIIGTVSADIGGNVAGLLRRVDLFLEESDWENAELYCERILDIDAENAEAYLRKLLIDYKLKTKSQLKEVADRFGKNTNYLRILRFDPNNLGAELQKYVIDFEQTQLEKNYQEATKLKEEQRYDEAYRIFNTISDYKDSSLLAAECLKLDEIKSTEDLYKYAEELFNSGRNEKTYLEAAERYKNLGDYLDSVYKHKESIRLAEIARKESIYIEANKLIGTNSIYSLKSALTKFNEIKDYKDVEHKIQETNLLIDEINLKIEKEAKKKRVKIISLVSIVLIVIIGFFSTMTIIKNNKPDEDFLEFELQNNDTYMVTGFKGNRKKLSIPAYYKGKKVTVIGEDAFVRSKFKTITIPNTVVWIQFGVFSWAEVENIYFEKNSELVLIEEFAFYQTKNLKNIVLPNGLEYLGRAFYEFNTDYIVIPNTIIYLGSGVFEHVRTTLYFDVPFDNSKEWHADWKLNFYGNVYWKNEWTYNSKGKPVPK